MAPSQKRVRVHAQSGLRISSRLRGLPGQRFPGIPRIRSATFASLAMLTADSRGDLEHEQLDGGALSDRRPEHPHRPSSGYRHIALDTVRRWGIVRTVHKAWLAWIRDLPSR